MLPECPLVAPDDRSTVLTGACGSTFHPVGGTLAHQFSIGRVDPPPLLVAGQGRSSGHEPCFQAAEQQVLPTEVLEFVGSGSQLFTSQITNGT